MRANPLIGEGNSIPKLQKLREDYSSYVKEARRPTFKRNEALKRQGRGEIIERSTEIKTNIPLSRHHNTSASPASRVNNSGIKRTLEIPNLKLPNNPNRPSSQARAHNATINSREQNNRSGLSYAPKLLPEVFPNPEVTMATPSNFYNSFSPMNPYPVGGFNTPGNFGATMPMNYGQFQAPSPYMNMVPQYANAPMPQQFVSPPSHFPERMQTPAKTQMAPVQRELEIDTSFDSNETLAKTNDVR